MLAGVLVNHNTADYAELALRSLRRSDPDVAAAVTLFDNASTEPTDALIAYADLIGARVVQSGYALQAGRNTHGENVARFILENADAGFFLVMDADICFLEEGSVEHLLRELDAEPDAWAVQAKMTMFAEILRPGWAPKPSPEMFSRVITRWGDDFGLDEAESAFRSATTSYRGAIQSRPHPFCLLIRNTPTLQRVIEGIGFSTAFVNADLPCGGWYDTGALASKVLATHDLSWFIATAKPVLHYAWVSERKEAPELLRAKLEDCQRRLAEYRARDGRRL